MARQVPERAKRPPGEALVDLRRRLSLLAPRDSARADVIARMAQAYGISPSTVYRSLRELTQPKSVRRADHGTTKSVPPPDMERYAEIVAALKMRTSNKKGHRLSTRRAIELLEDTGIETPEGLIKAPKGLLKRPTLDRFMRNAGYDHARITRPVAAIRFQAKRANELTRAGRVAVSRSLAVEKKRVTLSTLIEALFYDLGDKNVAIPKPPEKRDRELRDLVRKARRPVVLIIDDAQDLHPKTLTGLKRLIAVASGGSALLSILLAAHPKLRIDLRRPEMEQVGYRTSIFEYDGVAGHRRDYIIWLLGACAEDGVKVSDIIDDEAIDLLAEKLRAPLQIEMHLEFAFAAAFRVGAKPMSAEIVDGILNRAIDDLGPRLIRNGYDAATLAREFGVKPAEIRVFLAGTLEAERARELTEKMRAAGVPL